MNTNLIRRLRCVALAAIALGLSAAAHAQYAYIIEDLSALTGVSSIGISINNSGQVAGYFNTANNASSHAVRWTGTTAEDLGTLGGTAGYGYGINNSGQVAGFANIANDAGQYGVVWTGTTPAVLDTMGGTNSQAYTINDSGQSTGYVAVAFNVNHAVRWNGTTMQDLGTLGGVSSYGDGINASGQVAGFSYITGNMAQHAFFWDGTTMTDLGTLGGNVSVAFALNDSGQVVGGSLLATNASHAFRYSGTTMQDLGTLGGDRSLGEGINNAGTVVGYALLANGTQHACYAPGNTVLDLNTVLPVGSGWTLTDAHAINDKGQITGQGTIKGKSHAYRMSPVAVTLSGAIALQGVADLSQTSSYAPLGTFHIALRTPGTTTEVMSVDATLTTSSGSAFGTYPLSKIPFGTYDLAIKGGKTLRLVVPNVTIGYGASLPNVTLLTGDANGDNLVDVADFGVVVNAYGGSGSVADSGYDPNADFNYDGLVDIADFGLLVNNYGSNGVP